MDAVRIIKQKMDTIEVSPDTFQLELQFVETD